MEPARILDAVFVGASLDDQGGRGRGAAGVPDDRAVGLVGGDELSDAEDGQGVGHAEDQSGEEQEAQGRSGLAKIAGE